MDPGDGERPLRDGGARFSRHVPQLRHDISAGRGKKGPGALLRGPFIAMPRCQPEAVKGRTRSERTKGVPICPGRSCCERRRLSRLLSQPGRKHEWRPKRAQIAMRAIDAYRSASP